ncbi:MAG: M50 family metallopeptidase [Pseudomonadota bacterium]
MPSPSGFSVAPGSQAEQVGRLIIALVLVLWVPSLPGGNYVMYPFVILTTWFHEMGHGLAAMLMGQQFSQLIILPNGSGLAEVYLDRDAGRLTLAVFAAGGPLAPVLVGAGLIVASAHPRAWRPVLWGLAAAIMVSVLLYVRSPVGIAVLPLVAAGLGLIAWKAPDGLTRFALQFLGMLGALSMVADFDYLFSEEAVIAGQVLASDTGAIEDALFLPHWVWASLILVTSIVTVGASLKYALSDERRKLPPPKPPANVLQFKRKP